MKFLAIPLLLLVTSCARHSEWQSITTLIVFSPVEGAKEAFEWEVAAAEFKKSVFIRDPILQKAVSKAQVRTRRHTAFIEIVVSANSREASLEAGRALANAAIALAKKEPKSRIDVRISDPPAITHEGQMKKEPNQTLEPTAPSGRGSS